MNQIEEVHNIISELAKIDEQQFNFDPKIKELIQRAKLTMLHNQDQANNPYYSVKDVAELFDVNKQTVYKWIAEEKIVYEEEDSPGKRTRKGYRIPQSQFQGEYGYDDKRMNQVDPTFRGRREEETNEIPNTGFNSDHLIFPEHSKKTKSIDEMKLKIKGLGNES